MVRAYTICTLYLQTRQRLQQSTYCRTGFCSVAFSAAGGGVGRNGLVKPRILSLVGGGPIATEKAPRADGLECADLPSRTWSALEECASSGGRLFACLFAYPGLAYPGRGGAEGLGMCLGWGGERLFCCPWRTLFIHLPLHHQPRSVESGALWDTHPDTLGIPRGIQRCR